MKPAAWTAVLLILLLAGCEPRPQPAAPLPGPVSPAPEKPAAPPSEPPATPPAEAPSRPPAEAPPRPPAEAPATQPPAPPAAPAPAAPAIDLGANVSLHGRLLLPPDNPWNRDISAEPLDPNSDALVASIGLDASLHPDVGPRYGIPYVVVPGDQPRAPVTFQYPDESDPGPYPVPPDPPIEGGPDSRGDRHILMLDRDHWVLYELFAAYPAPGGGWRAGSGAIFDLASNRLRPAGWTSADAAGLPVLPGLLRYDEVYEAGAVRHAIRFTCKRTRRAYVPPATHFASRSRDPNLPPMGMRVRLKAGYDVSGFSRAMQVILKGLKTYGMILADNGGNWFFTGAPHPDWNDDDLNTLKRVKGRDFEVVRMEDLVAD